MISPDTVGPTAGATEITMLTVPKNAPRRSGGTSAKMVVVRSGSIRAVPDACTIRPPSRSAKPGATPANSVPKLKSPKAVKKSVRVPKRSIRKPVAGIVTAIGSKKAVDNHCTVLALTSSSVIRRGKATFMMVSFKMTTKVATSIVKTTPRSRLESPAALGDGAREVWVMGLLENGSKLENHLIGWVVGQCVALGAGHPGACSG